MTHYKKRNKRKRSPKNPKFSVLPVLTDSSVSSMSTQLEIKARHSFARSFLERNAKVQTVATMISAKYGVSRTTSYEDIKAVHAEMQLSEDGPSSEEASEPIDTDTILAMLQHSLEVTVATSDHKMTCGLIKAINQAKQWNGYAPTSVSPTTYA